MNYLELNDKINIFLNAIPANCPILKSLLIVHLEREFINSRNSLLSPKSNMVMPSFGNYIREASAEYLVRRLVYHLALPLNYVDRSGSKILMSPSMITRFPDLVKNLVDKNDVLFFIGYFDCMPVLKNGYVYKKIGSIVYGDKIVTMMSSVVKKIQEQSKSSREYKVDLFDNFIDVENELEIIISKLSNLILEYNITQYISAFSNRYIDVLLAHACRRAKIPSKEMAHGMNNYTIENGQTLIPRAFDYLFYWENGMLEEAKRVCGDYSRLKAVGYPKYSMNRVMSLQKRIRQQRKMVYFSQPIYDTFDVASPIITSDIIEGEKLFRKEMFKKLCEFCNVEGLDLVVRYHNGEKGKARELEKDYLIKELNIQVSTNSFEYDLFSCEIAVGINTSCLYEAMIIGKKVIQIEFPYNKNTYHKKISKVSIEELNKLEYQKLISWIDEAAFIDEKYLLSVGVAK